MRAVRKTMTPTQDEPSLSARDLLALQAFELAARTGSFKAAAEALHITASAVSHRIAGLERTLGAKLFERGPRGVGLSPAGTALAATTGHAFGDLSRALARQSSGSRRLRVSVLSDAGELREQPVQIDGDNALTLPVSINLSAGAVRLLQSG